MNCTICNTVLNDNTWSKGKQRKSWYICNMCHINKYKRYRQRHPFRAQASWFNSENKSNITEDDLINLFSKQNGCCAICQDELGKGKCVDHIISKDGGGNSNIENLQYLCEMCNIGKYKYSMQDYIGHCKKVAAMWKNIKRSKSR